VHIERLSAHGFRNLRVDFEPQSRFVVLQGDNGQGKTNLLEAVALCTTAKSFRVARPLDMLIHGGDAARIAVRFRRQEVRHEVVAELSARGRRLRVDDRLLRSAAGILEWTNVVSFFPEDLQILKGGPELRRRFLDRAVANHSPAFVAASIAYQQALKSRNALLKRGDTALLATYDKLLILHGPVIHAERQQTLTALADAARDILRTLCSEFHAVSFGIDDGHAHVAPTLQEALHARRRLDAIKGYTTVGPHRADLYVQVDGYDARAFASQGQQRGLILALKLAEVAALAQVEPLVLLDDVSSELDARKNGVLMEHLSVLPGQVWVTTTGTAALCWPAEAHHYSVRAGRIETI
jgi:DNA replication and repair protein RecF